MATLTITYSLTDEAVNAEFLLSGNQDSNRELTIEATELTSRQREQILELKPHSLPAWEFIREYDLSLDDPLHKHPPLKKFNHELTIDEAIEALKQSQTQKEKAAIKHMEYLSAKREQEEKERAEEKTRKKLEAEAREKARVTWIAKHGSDHLKRACAAGHDCIRLYYTEYAAKKYLGAMVDFDEHAEIAKRSCPTVKALNLRDKLLSKHYVAKVEIVWLKNFPLNEVGISDEDLYDREQEFEPYEAIMITDPAFGDNNLFIGVED